MDSILQVQQRILNIQARFPSPTAPVSNPATAGAFAQVLAQVSGTAAGTGAGTSAATHTHQTSGSAKAQFAKYGNGRIPEGQLATIGRGNHRLFAPAATSFRQLLDAAARDGVKIGVTDSYRSYSEQVDLARRKGLYSQGGLAAKPGTSEHGWGLSLDLDLNAKAQAWMQANAGRFGFSENVPREPWHWTYTAGR